MQLILKVRAEHVRVAAGGTRFSMVRRDVGGQGSGMGVCVGRDLAPGGLIIVEVSATVLHGASEESVRR